MQNCCLLIENYQEHQPITLSILAKLSQINEFGFGIACFNTLTDLMKSGREMEEEVELVIKNEVIKDFKGRHPKEVSVSLLQGLFQLV